MNGLRATISAVTAFHPSIITNDFSSLHALAAERDTSGAVEVEDGRTGTVPRQRRSGLPEHTDEHTSAETACCRSSEAKQDVRAREEEGVARERPGLSTLFRADPRLPMAELAERLVSQVMLLLSMGLHDGVDVWPVLETLTLIPAKLETSLARPPVYKTGKASAAVVGNARARVVVGQPVSRGEVVLSAPVASSSASAVSLLTTSVVKTGTPVREAWPSSSAARLPSGGIDWARNGKDPLAAERETAVRLLQKRLHFAPQLIRTVESGYPDTPTPVRVRIFLRLALNYGCLCSSLELIARHNRREIEHFYKHPELNLLFHYKQPALSRQGGETERTGSHVTGADADRQEGVFCASDGGGFMVSHGDLWEQFHAAMAPAGGVPLADIEAGATKGFSLLHFALTLFVPGIDDDLADYAQPPTLATYLRSWDDDEEREGGQAAVVAVAGAGAAAAAAPQPIAARSLSGVSSSSSATGVVRGVVLPTPSATATAATAADSTHGAQRQAEMGRASSSSPSPQPHSRAQSSVGFDSPSFHFAGADFLSDGGGATVRAGEAAVSDLRHGVHGHFASPAAAAAGGGTLSACPSPSLGPLPGPTVKCFYHHLGEYLFGLTRTPPPAARCVRNHFLAKAWRAARRTEAMHHVMIQVLPVGSGTRPATTAAVRGSGKAHTPSHTPSPTPSPPPAVAGTDRARSHAADRPGDVNISDATTHATATTARSGHRKVKKKRKRRKGEGVDGTAAPSGPVTPRSGSSAASAASSAGGAPGVPTQDSATAAGRQRRHTRRKERRPSSGDATPTATTAATTACDNAEATASTSATAGAAQVSADAGGGSKTAAERQRKRDARTPPPSAGEAVTAFERVRGGQWASAVVGQLTAGLTAAVHHHDADTTPNGATRTASSGSTDSNSCPAGVDPAASFLHHHSAGPSARAGGPSEAAATCGDRPASQRVRAKPFSTPPLVLRLAQRRREELPSDVDGGGATRRPSQAEGEGAPSPPRCQGPLAQRAALIGETKAPPLVRTLKAMRRASGLSANPVAPHDAADLPASLQAAAAGTEEEKRPATETPAGASAADGGERVVPTASPQGTESGKSTVTALASATGATSGTPIAIIPSAKSPHKMGSSPPSSSPPDSIDALLDELAMLLEAYKATDGS